MTMELEVRQCRQRDGGVVDDGGGGGGGGGAVKVARRWWWHFRCWAGGEGGGNSGGEVPFPVTVAGGRGNRHGFSLSRIMQARE